MTKVVGLWGARSTALALAGLLAPAALGTPAPPAFDASLAPAKAAIGDRVVATYATTLPEGATLDLEALVTPAREEGAAAQGPALEYERPTLSVRKVAGGVTWTLAVPLTPFVAGEVAVPGPRLLYREAGGPAVSVRPPGLSIAVSSRLPDGRKPEDLSPKADRETRIPSRSVWFWIGLAVLAAALAGLVWRLLRKKPAAPGAAREAPPVLPGAELLAELAKLEREAAALGADPRVFYSRLTHAVKRYLERRLGLPVLEWTTFETLRRLRDSGIDTPREAALPDLLAAADRVKFAKAASTRAEAVEQVARARVLHDALERRAAEEEARRRAAEAAPAARGAKAPGRKTA